VWAVHIHHYKYPIQYHSNSDFGYQDLDLEDGDAHHYADGHLVHHNYSEPHPH
jgi:hypothetical protein